MRKIVIIMLVVLLLMFASTIFLLNNSSSTGNGPKYKSSSSYKKAVGVNTTTLKRLENEFANKHKSQKLFKLPFDKKVDYIDSDEEKCTMYAYTAADLASCTLTAEREWYNGIVRYLGLLQKIMPSKEYSQIKASQRAWEKSTIKDRELLNKYVLSKSGTAHLIETVRKQRTMTRERAIFLRNIYFFYYQEDMEKQTNQD